MTAKGSRHRPWFPFYASDFAGTVRTWSCEEIGAYILLLSEQWINGNVPVDDQSLARIHPDLPTHWRTRLQQKFPDGMNARMHEIRNEMVDRSEQGKKAARARWDKEKDGDDADAYANAHADDDADASAELHAAANGLAMVSIPTPIPIDKPKPKKKKTSLVSDSMWKKFCDVYPKRNGPDPNKSARAKAERALKKGAHWSDIMTGLRRYKSHCETSDMEAQFIMRKETFLNPEKEFWNAEYATASEQPRQGAGTDRPPTSEEILLDMADVLGIKRRDEESDASYRDRLGKANAKRIAQLGR